MCALQGFIVAMMNNMMKKIVYVALATNYVANYCKEHL
jgi:hypothetical protein